MEFLLNVFENINNVLWSYILMFFYVVQEYFLLLN
ncbi:sodium:alanine symporter family protein [Clostridium botulinum CFSAN001628]|nr:sodium:alanine symporter family protein [Clostridium botulinum CFSAN001628]